MGYSKESHISRRVFAYLTSQADTTITTALTYYPINGTFANVPLDGFSTVADPAIQYGGEETLYFEVDWHAVLSADSNAATCFCGIKVDGVLEASSVMQAYLKTANEPQSLSGTTIISLSNGQKVQLVATSDGDGDVITFKNFTTTIRRFT